MAEKNSMRNKIESMKLQIKANKAVVSTDKQPKRSKTTTEQMASSLRGDKQNGMVALKLKIKTKKSASKQCHDKEIVPVVATATVKTPTITPTIYLQDNLLKVSRYLDLNALRLDTTNDDNAIDFDVASCKKLFDKGIKFFVEAGENPLPEILEEVASGSALKKYLPKGYEPYLQAMFTTLKGKKVYEHAITFSQIEKTLERGLCKLNQVVGRITQQQATVLGLKHIDGEYFSYYVSN